ncbi:MAG: HlyD family efflux transporter periplasmic adaptor subunit [Candidatus Gracilibacteria bacterium]|nr:HlyD family efflux transporter periplasmic adaptor subunit [Candidatus Gracilibacteria bacterium]
MKKILSILLVSSLFLASCGTTEIVEKKFYKTFTVKNGSLTSKDSILATVEGKNSTSLSFKAPGRISEIYVKKGDNVKTGDILAKLSNDEGGISYSGLSNILSDMNSMGGDIASMGGDTAKMKVAVDNLYEQRIQLLENSYEKSKIATQMAEKDLALAIKTLDDSSKMFSGSLTSVDQKIKQAENALKMANNNLDNSRKLLEQEKINIRKNALNSLSNAYIIARNALEYTDIIIGVTDSNKYKNDSYEVYLGAKNSSTKTYAEKLFREFNAKYSDTYKYYQSNIVSKTDIPEDIIVIMLGKASETLENLRTLLHSTQDMLDNSISSSTFNDEMLSGMKTQITALLSNLEMAILSPTGAGIKGSQEAITSFQNNYDLKIKQLEDARDIANDDVNLAKTGQDINKSDVSKNRSNLETNIKIKEDQLSLSRIGEQEVLKNIEMVKKEKISKLAEIDTNLSEIASKLGELDSKKSETSMNMNLASESIESGIIRAPFDAIILDKLSDLGTVIGAGMPIFNITSLDKKLVKTYIDNSVYNKKIGDKIILRNPVNAVEIEGNITLIDGTQDLIKKKNYLELELNGEGINIGDRVTILLNENNDYNINSIIIPSKSVIYKYSEPGVLILDGKTAKFKLIKVTGRDSEFVSVEGLKIGEKVIVDGKDNILDGEVLVD